MSGPRSPICPEQLHYADPSANHQTLPLSPRILALQHPTLGFPALLTAGQALVVILSLPDEQSPSRVRLSLVDRHRGNPDVELRALGEPERLEASPSGRVAWRLSLALDGVAPALYDLVLSRDGERETQPNSVAVYDRIRGDETVVFSGDSQFHGLNRRCLLRWVELLNARDDVAWVALVGDVCDNDVQSPQHLLQLSATIGPGPVVHHYATEYPESHAILSTLRHPVVLVPGNHDGMVAYEDYAPGQPTTVYLGPDPLNRVAYDGLHHFRVTFGPLYFSFDWGGTRYLALNSFDLPRHQRLGYHAVVSNWGGSLGAEQLGWLERTLAEADALGLHKVVLSHHDPRGGSKGAALGRYHDVRPFNFSSLGVVLKEYLAYLLKHGRQRWQQEWMRLPGEAANPARPLLELLARHRVAAVVMGHDNLNWFERYAPGDDLFAPREPEVIHYRGDTLPAALEARVPAVSAALAQGDAAGALALVSDLSEEDGALVLTAAAERDIEEEVLIFRSGDDEDDGWRPTLVAPITFLHVDDIGAYTHAKERHMRDYGYVEVRLRDGAPKQVRAMNLSTEPPGTWETVLVGE